MWYQETVFYELYIRAFKDSNGDGHGDIRGLIEKLDYIQALGVGCIWILPHFPSPLKDDGYDVADYCDIHPDYGSLDDFKELVAEAHARDLRIVIDLVMNHTSDQHPWFQAARADRNSPYRDYYVWSDTGTEYADIRLVFPDFEPSNWTYDEVAGQYFWHRFFRTQPDLNYDNPAVHQEMLDVVRFWLALGVDGFRLDAIIYLYEREGTDGAGLPETHAFIRKVRALVDNEFPECVMIAEANDWPDKLMAYYGEDNECHMCFNFPLMPRLFLALLQQNAQPIIDIVNQTPAPPAKAQWLNFLRNHDELTLEMVTDEEGAALYAAYAPEPRMKINNGIRRRLAPIIEHDPQKYRLLNALLMALPGTPVIYYGDEVGMADDIHLPDRNGVRTPMQWSAETNAGFSQAAEPYSPVAADFERLNVAAQEDRADSFLNITRRLIHTRQQQSALRRGSLTFVETGNAAVLGFWRKDSFGQILCLFNLSSKTITIKTLPTEYTMSLLDGSFDGVSLPPFAAYWLKRRS